MSKGREEIFLTQFSSVFGRFLSPLNTQEAIQIVKSTCRRLVKARINDCHRRLNYCNNKLQQQLDKLKQLLPTNLLDTVTTIADRRAEKTTERVRTEQERKLTRLQRNKDKKRPKTDENWVRNISSRPLDKTETHVLSYGLKHSVTPKRIPTESIVFYCSLLDETFIDLLKLTQRTGTQGTSETISRILQPYNIRVAHKPTITLRQLLTNVKDKDEPNNRQGAVYKIKCSDCQASYIGETGRNLNTRLTEHKRATKNGDANNHIAVHHQLTNHNIDWDSAQCLTYSTNYFQRLTLESWYTNLEQTPLNRCQQLPAPYKRLIHDGNETDKRTSNGPT